MNRKTENPRNTYSRNSSKSARQAPAYRSSQMSVDERIVSRQMMRHKKNRRKKLIIRAVLGTAFLLAALILVLVLFFNINTITVSGDDIYSDADIVAASNVKIGDNLIFVSAKKINSKITETLPYAGSVKIKRRLPATLEIVVTKTVAEYAIMTDGAYALLDGSGKVLEKGLDFVGENIIVANLGTVTSAEAGKTIVLEDEQIFDKLMKLKSAFSETGITGITSVDITNIYDIKLVYQGRITLILGETDGNKMNKKLSFAKEAIKTQDEENNAYRGTINLTVSGKAYWAEETLPEVSETEPEEPSTDENGSAVSDDSTDGNTDKNSDEKPEESTSAAA